MTCQFNEWVECNDLAMKCDTCVFGRNKIRVDAAADKTMFHLLPWEAIRLVADLMTKMEGIEGGKHPSGTWKTQSVEYHLDAAFRHIVKWLGGERVDRESGMSHLVHAAFRLLAAAEVARGAQQG